MEANEHTVNKLFQETPNIESKISASLFDKNKLIRHPLISGVRPGTLAYRSVALLRVVSVIDEVLDVLVGPSLPRYLIS